MNQRRNAFFCELLRFCHCDDLFVAVFGGVINYHDAGVAHLQEVGFAEWSVARCANTDNCLGRVVCLFDQLCNVVHRTLIGLVVHFVDDPVQQFLVEVAVADGWAVFAISVKLAIAFVEASNVILVKASALLEFI